MDEDETQTLSMYEPIDTFELELRIRNNALKQRRENLKLTQGELAERVGISKATVTTYESLRKVPKNKQDEWRPTALCIAAFFQVPPEVLWPEVTQLITNPVIRRKADQQEVEKLYTLEMERAREQHQLTNPETHLMLVEQGESVQRAMSRLTTREQAVLNMHYGLDGNAHMSMADVSETFGISRTRAHQIEAQALRKLRHPSVSYKLDGPHDFVREDALRAYAIRFLLDQVEARGLKTIKCATAHSVGDRWAVPATIQLCVSCDEGNDAQMTVRVLANGRIVVLKPLTFTPTPVDKKKIRNEEKEEERKRRKEEEHRQAWIAELCPKVRSAVLDHPEGCMLYQLEQQFPGVPLDVLLKVLDDLVAAQWLTDVEGVWRGRWQWPVKKAR